MRKALIWLPIVVIFALAMEAWRLWGWRAGELSFHESWSPELRTELQELDACLLAETMRELVIDEISEDGDDDDDDESETDEPQNDEDGEEDDDEEEDDESEADEPENNEDGDDDDDDDDDEIDVFEAPFANEENEVDDDYQKRIERALREKSNFPWLYLRKSIELRDRLTQARRNLKETAAKGYQPQDQRHTTTAHLAARFGKAALLRELVKRGVAPYTWDETLMTTVFNAAIVGLPYADHAPLPVQEKLELLDFLHSRSFFTEESVDNALEASIDAMNNDKDDKGQTLEWLIAHGFRPQSLSVWRSLICVHKSREIIQRLVNQEKLKIEPFDVSCMLEGTLECAAWGGKVKDTLLWLLDDLHADLSDPLFHEPSEQRSFISRYISQLLNHADFNYKYNRDVALHLDYIEILLAHGARLSPKEINALRPKNKKLRARFDAIIQAHQP